jgi:hypothetical protein
MLFNSRHDVYAKIMPDLIQLGVVGLNWPADSCHLLCWHTPRQHTALHSCTCRCVINSGCHAG